LLTIQFAFDCSYALDRIVIAPGTYAQNLQLGGQRDLIGAGAGSTIIEPTSGGTGPVLSIPGAFGYRSPVRISGVTITGGSSASNGGGISIGTYPDETGSLVLVDSEVTGNTAAYDGGGIYVEVGSSIRLINTRVVDNTAYEGGGIYSDGGGCFHYKSSVAANVPNDIVGC
jgi:predicted outer membrane repeat protein